MKKLSFLLLILVLQLAVVPAAVCFGAAPSPSFGLSYDFDDEGYIQNALVTIPYGEEEAAAIDYASYKLLMVDGSMIKNYTIVTEKGNTLVPVRIVSETLNAEVGWNQTEQKVTVKKDGAEIIITVGSSKALVNGKELTLAAPAKNVKGSVFVPFRFIAENLGATVGYDDKLFMTNGLPVIWIESKEFSQGGGAAISKEKAVEDTRALLFELMAKYDEKPKYGGKIDEATAAMLTETFGNLSCNGELSAYWVLGTKAPDYTHNYLLVNKYTGESFYFRGAYGSLWVDKLDADAIGTLFLVG